MTKWKTFVAIGALATCAAACGTLRPLPTSPHLEVLTEQSVFAAAPPAEWPTPTPDDPATGPVTLTCGVGPQLGDGHVYAAVSLTGKAMDGLIPPLNVALVLDRSGSMSGKPFSNMLRAAETFMQAARDGDRMSVVVFSDGVFEALPPVVMDAASRADAIARIRALQDGGGTWMSGGLLGGYHEIFSTFEEWDVSQVVLLSDGQPTQGITNSESLFTITARAAEHGVGTTTIGFGPGHDELLMQGMADAGGGTYYYVGEAGDIPSIFQKEANAILRTAVRGTWAVIDLPRGADVEDVIGWDYFVFGPQLHIFMGGIPYGEERYAVIKFAPGGAPSGALPLSVTYSDVTRRARFGLDCALKSGPTGGKDAWVLEAAGHAEAAWGLAEAMGWADGGSEVFAISQIAYARDLVKTLAAAGAPAGSLQDEDALLLNAQTRLGIGVAGEAADSFLGGGVSGIMNFGAKTAERTATAAVVDGIDKSFRPLIRKGMPFQIYGRAGTRYSARGQRVFKLHDSKKSTTYKRARFDAYIMMRVR